MALMMRRKRYKFQVDLKINELTEVTFGKAVLFAKIRQLDGGGFTGFSKRNIIAVCYSHYCSFAQILK